MSTVELPVRDPARRYAVSAVFRPFLHAPLVFVVGPDAEPRQVEPRIFAAVPVHFFRVAPEAEYPVDEREIYPQLKPQDAVYHVASELELFTESEADTLSAWLRDDADIERPEKSRVNTLPAGCMPYRAIPAGVDSDFWICARSARYDLPFVVEGWVDYDSGRIVDGLASDQLGPLLDLARRDDRATFRDLARALGVPDVDVDILWSGTQTRLGLEAEPTGP